jgi:hypothetical protein
MPNYNLSKMFNLEKDCFGSRPIVDYGYYYNNIIPLIT